MNFLAKFNQLSSKRRIAIFISALWFLFWVVIGWGESFLGGVAFGGTPLIIVWGFWFLAVQSQKDADMMGGIQYSLSLDTSGRREFPRLVYPSAKRPKLKYGEHKLEIIDISEKGLKISNEGQVDLGKSINGKAILLSGRSIHVDGVISWSLDNQVGLLMALIPSFVIAEERRVLSTKKFKSEKH